MGLVAVDDAGCWRAGGTAGGGIVRWAHEARGRAGVFAALMLTAAMMAGCSQAVPAAVTRSSSTAWPALPPGSSRPGQLSGVAAVSAHSAWAVGVRNDRKLLAEHWDGRVWSKVAIPDPARGFVPLQAVAAGSASDVWAVGEIAFGGHTLILRWNGKRWQRVSSPDPSSQGDGLAAVAAASDSDVWAVGQAGSSSIFSTTLIEHWNGRSWAHVPSPAPQPGCGGCRFPGDSLSGVAVVSTSDAWAVGGSGHGVLIERWDGVRWKWVRGPAAAAPGGSLSAVTALSATDAWAVGSIKGATLTENWDGTTWTRVPSPSPAPAIDGSMLTSVAATSASDVWAVGYTGGKTLILHWDGATWTRVPAPSPGDEPEFLAVAATSADSAWAVGLSGDDHTLIAHWDGKTWTRQADRRPR
jgi:hypothetical protein